MTELSIMTVASESSAANVPALLLEERGLWRRTELLGGSVDPLQARDALNEALRSAVATDSDVEQPIEALQYPAMALYRAIVPTDVTDALKQARDAIGGEEAPLLRIHVEPRYEWIPWEVLHDGTDFLGLRFRIARLPIVVHPPEQPDDFVHPVRHVRSVLGRHVTEPTNGDFERWRQTFDALLPDGVETQLSPADASDTGWPQISALGQAADILYVTCHGMHDERTGPFWTLDPQRGEHGGFAYELSRSVVSSLTDTFHSTRPLVFGNACAETGASVDPEAGPPLATDLFRTGALNFVGSLAPLRRELAITFARLFYEELLRERHSIGQALLDAKRRCRESEAARTDPTYLFYCLYGPPETKYGVADG